MGREGLACGALAIVAIGTGGTRRANILVIKMSRAPGKSCVAILAGIAGQQMIGRFARGVDAVMALGTSINHACVIKHTQLP